MKPFKYSSPRQHYGPFYSVVVALLSQLSVGCSGAECLDGRDKNEDLEKDGLPDCFEDGQGDVDGDGKADRLSDHALSSKQRDIIIRYDWMECSGNSSGACADGHTHEPDPGALSDLEAAFLKAPTDPIHVHFERGGPVPHRDICDCDCEAKLVREEKRYLNANERELKYADELAAGREKYIRYALFSHQHEAGSSSGVSCGKSGFLQVSLGDSSYKTASGQYGDKIIQACSLMHELGHNLGLEHGGKEEVNGKPNYLSVMNYAFAPNCSDIGLAYSREKLPDLDETALIENDGIGLASGATAQLTVFFRPNLTEKTVPAAGAIDWDRNGTANQTVAQDLNGDSICIKGGKDRKLQSRPQGDDEVFDGTGKAFVTISDRARISAGDLAVPSAKVQGAWDVYAGTDFVLDTVLKDGDDAGDFWIAAGENFECNSRREGNDQDPNSSNRNVRLLKSFDDWSHLNLASYHASKGGLGDALPELEPDDSTETGERTPAEMRLRRESDLVVEPQVNFDALRGEVTWTLTVGNAGPEPTVEGAAIVLDLPATARDFRCEGTAGSCELAVNRNSGLLLTPELAVGQAETWTVRFKVSAEACETPDLYTARVTSLLSNTEANSQNDTYWLPFPDTDGDGKLDVCSWSISELAVYGEEELRLANQARVLHGEEYGLIASRGLSALHLDTDAQVGHLLSDGDAFLATRAKVHGDLTVFRSLTRQTDSLVEGALQTGRHPSPALPRLLIQAEFPAAGAGREVYATQSFSPLPGGFGRVAVFGGGTLTLSPGDYYFDKLILEAGAQVHVFGAEGVVRLFVKSELISRGEWNNTDADGSRLLVAFLGQGDAPFETSFAGTILAPWATVRFGDGSGRILNGALLARRVELRPGTVVRQSPFEGQFPW